MTEGIRDGTVAEVYDWILWRACAEERDRAKAAFAGIVADAHAQLWRVQFRAGDAILAAGAPGWYNRQRWGEMWREVRRDLIRSASKPNPLMDRFAGQLMPRFMAGELAPNADYFRRAAAPYYPKIKRWARR